MAETFKDKAKEAGHKVAEKASEMGHRISERAEEAADWAKEKAHQAGDRMAEAAHKVQHKVAPGTEAMGSTAGIREHQEVYASCGTKVGTVDRVEGSTIKLTKNDSPDGMHHRIPMSWVKKVGDRVELDRDHLQVQREWQTA